MLQLLLDTPAHCLLIANYFMLFVFMVKDESPTFAVEAHKQKWIQSGLMDT